MNILEDRISMQRNQNVLSKKVRTRIRRGSIRTLELLRREVHFDVGSKKWNHEVKSEV